jgi:uncharacterized membrane protein
VHTNAETDGLVAVAFVVTQKVLGEHKWSITLLPFIVKQSGRQTGPLIMNVKSTGWAQIYLTLPSFTVKQSGHQAGLLIR